MSSSAKKSLSLLAATIVVVLAGAMAAAAPASAAGICDQQGVRRKIGGVWHKFVLLETVSCGPKRYCTRWQDCGAWNAF